MRRFNLLRVLPAALFFVFMLLLLLVESSSVVSMVVLWLVSVLSAACVATWLARKFGARWDFRLRGYLRHAMRFGWHSHLGAVIQYMQHRVDVLLVGLFLPLRELGIYSLAVSLAEVLWHVPYAVATVLLAHVTRHGVRATREITPQVCRTTLAITAVLSLSLAALAGWAIPQILPAFEGAVRVFHWMLPGIVAASLFKVLASDFVGRGEPLKTFYPAFTTLGVCAVAGWMVIPSFGVLGAAAVATAGYVLNSALYLGSYLRLTAVPMRDVLVLRRSDLTAVTSLWRGSSSGTSSQSQG
jgi:O-antigen/teichoic acid export membrane protein